MEAEDIPANEISDYNMDEKQDDDQDIHICGRCEQQFTDYILFVKHKKQHKARKSDVAALGGASHSDTFTSKAASENKNNSVGPFQDSGESHMDLQGQFTNTPCCQQFADVSNSVIMTEAQFHSNFNPYSGDSHQNEALHDDIPVTEITRLSPEGREHSGAVEGTLPHETYNSSYVLMEHDKDAVSVDQISRLQNSLVEANREDLQLGSSAVFNNVLMDVDGTKILHPSVGIVEANNAEDTVTLTDASQSKSGQLVPEASILLTESTEDELNPLNTKLMNHNELDQKESLSEMVNSNRSSMDTYMTQGTALQQSSGVEDRATTVSTTGNIQITLTPGGIQLEVQNLPPNVQAALQSGLERGVNASPSLTNVISYDNKDAPITVSQNEATSAVSATTQTAPAVKPKSSASTQKKFACKHENCTFTASYQKDLDRHIRKHTGERPFVCQICSKDFTRSDKLKIHMRAHSGVKPFQCTECDYATTDSGSLKKHLRTHTGERPFKCQICPYASCNSSQLVVHLRTHTGDSPYVCYVCHAKFKINSDLKRHLMLHTGEKPFKCDLCDYKCAVKSNLKTHYRVNHNEENAVSCSVCGYRTSSRKAFREHMRTHDPNHDIYKCTECTFTTSAKSSYKAHLKTHSTEKLYKCGLCNFSAKQSGNVTMHARRKHPGKFKECLKKGMMKTNDGDKSDASYQHDQEDVAIVKVERRRGKPPSKVRPVCKKLFECPQCKASFVREDSLRCHMNCHQQSDKMMSTALAVLQLQYPVDNSRCGTASVSDGEAAVQASESLCVTDSNMTVQGEYSIAPSHNNDTVTCYVVNGAQTLPVTESSQVSYTYNTTVKSASSHADVSDVNSDADPHSTSASGEDRSSQQLINVSDVTYTSPTETGSDNKSSMSVIPITNSSHILHTALVQSNISADSIMLPHNHSHNSFDSTTEEQTHNSVSSPRASSSRSPSRSTMSQSAHRIMAFMQNNQNLAVEENMHNMAAINRQAMESDSHVQASSFDTSSEAQAAAPLATQESVQPLNSLSLPSAVSFVNQPTSAQPGQVIMELSPENMPSLATHSVQLRPFLPSQMYSLSHETPSTLDTAVIQNVPSALPIHVIQPTASSPSALPMQLLVPVSMGTAASIATPLYTTTVSQVGSNQLVPNTVLPQAWSLQIPMDTDGLGQSQTVRSMSYEIIHPVAAESDADDTTTSSPPTHTTSNSSHQ